MNNTDALHKLESLVADAQLSASLATGAWQVGQPQAAALQADKAAADARSAALLADQIDTPLARSLARTAKQAAKRAEG